MNNGPASLRIRPQLFRCFVTNQYYANRDEWDAAGEPQPYTFDEYVNNNLTELRKDFKLHKRELVRNRRTELARMLSGC
jgi:hypothetical protein|tara:strand:- start:449 stop:685 length:237 start_codon:yes stop_codon:yes gene_type:complete